MTPDQIDIARRAVACKHWHWLPGMRAIGKYPNNPVRIHNFGENVQDLDDMEAADTFLRWQQPIIHGDCGYDGPYLPDLSDPATLGCVLALVRDAWGDPRLVAIYCEPAHPGQSEGWAVQAADNRLPVAGGDHAREAEALVIALERAP